LETKRETGPSHHHIARRGTAPRTGDLLRVDAVVLELVDEVSYVFIVIGALCPSCVATWVVLPFASSGDAKSCASRCTRPS
jgi:hypothetical protein